MVRMMVNIGRRVRPAVLASLFRRLEAAVTYFSVFVFESP
jgi:hypothetical protein